MKPRKLTLLSLSLMVTLLIGAGAILTLSQKDIKANVKFDPKSYPWNGTPPDPWNAEISLTGGHKRDEIDTTTILLEATYTNSSPTYPTLHGPRLVVPFDGWHVKATLEAYLPYHMGILIPGRYRIPLEITGLLLTGETFRGSGTITVTVPESPG